MISFLQRSFLQISRVTFKTAKLNKLKLFYFVLMICSSSLSTFFFFRLRKRDHPVTEINKSVIKYLNIQYDLYLPLFKIWLEYLELKKQEFLVVFYSHLCTIFTISYGIQVSVHSRDSRVSNLTRRQLFSGLQLTSWVTNKKCSWRNIHSIEQPIKPPKWQIRI